MVLFGTNLVSNSSTKASQKHHIQSPISTFLMQITCQLNAHFSWEFTSYAIHIIHKKIK